MRPFREHEAGYAGVGVTFCRVPLVLEAAGLEGADVAILGAPFDEGVSYRPGTRFGPRAIRMAEDVALPAERPNMELGVDPLTAMTVVDYGDIAAVPSRLEESHARLREALDEIIRAGAVPVVLGGDHSLSYPTLQVLAGHYGRDGYSVIHFDTHADTGLSELETPHGTPFSRAVRDGFLDGGGVVQIGLRGAWPFPDEFEWMRQQGFKWHAMTQVIERGIGPVVRDAVDHARRRAPRTYLTIDIDTLDPAFAPGTGTPEPGGFATRELLFAARTIAGELDLCAMDLVEVSPPYDHASITAMAGHRIVLETLGGIALRRSGRPARPERP